MTESEDSPVGRWEELIVVEQPESGPSAGSCTDTPIRPCIDPSVIDHNSFLFLSVTRGLWRLIDQSLHFITRELSIIDADNCREISANENPPLPSAFARDTFKRTREEKANQRRGRARGQQTSKQQQQQTDEGGGGARGSRRCGSVTKETGLEGKTAAGTFGKGSGKVREVSRAHPSMIREEEEEEEELFWLASLRSQAATMENNELTSRLVTSRPNMAAQRHASDSLSPLK